MRTYKNLYLHLFNALTDALDDLHRGHISSAAHTLEAAQQQTEAWFMDCETMPDEPLSPVQR